MMDRSKSIIERIEERLKEEGFSKKNILESSETGLGDYNSFFDLMIDLRLDGKEHVAAQEIWEDMKKQINFFRRNLSKAADDYRKLENKYRGLQNDYEEAIKEKK